MTRERASASAAAASSSASSISSSVSSSMSRSVAYERPSRARKNKPDADADRRLDRLQSDAERDALCLPDAVVHERQCDGGLHQPDVARPQREDRRDVDEHEHEPGGRERQVDAERLHRRPHGEELAEPAGVLEGGSRRGCPAGAHDREPLARPEHELTDPAELAELAPPPRASRNPVSSSTIPTVRAITIDVSAQPGDLRREEHPDDECRRREDVEHAVREDRADERRGRAATSDAPPQDGDTGELADAPREHGVREQADARTQRRRARSADAAAGSTA